MKRTCTGFATVALLALGIMPASAAPGDAGGGQPPQGPPAAASALTPEQVADTVRLAEQTGVPSAVLLREAEGQEEFSALVERMRSDQPDHFVDGVWEPRGTTRGRIVFVEGAPQAAVNAVATVPGIEVRSTRAPSEQQRLAATEAAYQAATAEVGVAEAVVTSDPATGAVDVLFVAAPGNPGDAERVRAAARGRASMAAGQDVAVTVSQAPEQSIGEPEYRGGMRYNGSLGSCTGAFTLQSGSTYGISVAAHCGWVGSYDGGSFTTYQVAAAGDGDARWSRSTAGAPSPSFQYNFGAFRSATSGLNPAVGTTVCKFGYTTGYTCSTVYKTGICANGYCGLYSAEAYISGNGDSGGPWFFGSGAKGIHHGRATIDGVTRSLFTRIGIVNLLNAVVYTG